MRKLKSTTTASALKSVVATLLRCSLANYLLPYNFIIKLCCSQFPHRFCNSPPHKPTSRRKYYMLPSMQTIPLATFTKCQEIYAQLFAIFITNAKIQFLMQT